MIVGTTIAALRAVALRRKNSRRVVASLVVFMVMRSEATPLAWR
jgi:hypothetical protein